MPNNLASATKPRDTSKMVQVEPQGPPMQPSFPSPAMSADPEFSPLSIAPVPPVMGTDVDASRQFYRDSVSQIRTPPLPIATKIAAGAAAATQVIVSQTSSGNNIDLKTNNVDNSSQIILNITGPGVTYGPTPGEVQIASAASGSVIGPGFVFIAPGTETPVFVSNLIGSSPNGIGGILVFIPSVTTTTNFTFNVQVSDLTYYYVFGIYGPFTGVETTLPLVAQTAPAQYTSTTSQTVPWLSPATLQPGWYFIDITSDGSPPGLRIDGGPALAWQYGSFTVTPSTGSGASLILPNSVTVQAAAPTVQTGGSGSGKPSPFNFVLS